MLIEGTSKTDPMKLFGRTFTNKIVNFSGSKDLIGQIIDVKITGSNRNSLDGAIIGYKIDAKKHRSTYKT